MGSLHPNHPAWNMAVDMSGPPGFSPPMSLQMLEAEPPHRTGTTTPGNHPHIQTRERLLPGWHYGGGLPWGSQVAFGVLPTMVQSNSRET